MKLKPALTGVPEFARNDIYVDRRYMDGDRGYVDRRYMDGSTTVDERLDHGHIDRRHMDGSSIGGIWMAVRHGMNELAGRAIRAGIRLAKVEKMDMAKVDMAKVDMAKVDMKKEKARVMDSEKEKEMAEAKAKEEKANNPLRLKN